MMSAQPAPTLTVLSAFGPAHTEMLTRLREIKMLPRVSCRITDAASVSLSRRREERWCAAEDPREVMYILRLSSASRGDIC